MLVDGAGGCYYGQLMGTAMWKLVDYLNSASGWTKTGDEYLEIGRRIQTLRQLFNIKQGINPPNDICPNGWKGNPHYRTAH